jgi:bifunctional UDP-N-acetylglucosamine pyrophosphorylase/glucosamine-1-phosphate N-acetyltransferase
MEASGKDFAVVILAAGEGTRMKSDRAKVLHEIGGRPMLGYPLAVAEALDPAHLAVVIGRDSEQIEERFQGRAHFVVQAQRRGTGHAVQQALPALSGFSGEVLILYGDTPLLRAETIRRMREHKRERGADLVLLSARLALPGRVVRDASGQVVRIVEVTDASPEELAIEEGNTGVYLLDSELLSKTLAQLDDRNQQGELYLTDIVSLAIGQGSTVEALLLDDPHEALGVNSRAELAEAAAALRRRTAERLMAEGVTIVDPDSTYIDTDVEIGRDSRIDPGVVITGASRLGQRVHVKPHCVIESSRLDDDVELGPAAHLRPGCHLHSRVKIGNYVEVKNSDVGEGVKAAHLTYIGDADVGAGTTFGCGVITVNYDGQAKHRTSVGERVFVGCNTNLIAPVTLHDDTYVAAGSTITKEVPPNALAVARARQRNVEGWVARRREKGTAQKDPGSEAKSKAPEKE